MVKNITPHKAKHMPGETVYERYLRTEELLSLQKPESELTHHDELQFQIVHQVFELWWKETAFELNTIRALLQEYNVPSALRPRRASERRRFRQPRLRRPVPEDGSRSETATNASSSQNEGSCKYLATATAIRAPPASQTASEAISIRPAAFRSASTRMGPLWHRMQFAVEGAVLSASRMGSANFR